MKTKLKIYTLQSDYTLEQLKTEGAFSSRISNDEISEILFRDKLGDGLVYFYATESTDNLVNSIDLNSTANGRVLLELDNSILDRDHLLFSIERYSNLKLMCNSMTKYIKGGTDSEYLDIIYNGIGIEDTMIKFLQSCKSDSGIYVGIISSIYQRDVIQGIEVTNLNKTRRMKLGGN